jgi:hypothetical protein
MCKFLKFAKFELNQKICKTIPGQRAGFSTRPASTVLCGMLAQCRAQLMDRRRRVAHGAAASLLAVSCGPHEGRGALTPGTGWQWPVRFRHLRLVRWVGDGGWGNMVRWGARLRHIGEECLTGRPCPQRRSRCGGAHRRSAREVAEEGGQPVREVTGVRTVHREAPVLLGDGRSDPSTWMTLAAVGVDGGR